MNERDNQQGFLAEQFLIDEMTTNHDAYDAMMKIKHWKFIKRVPGIGSQILAEAGKHIENTFFSFVPASTILTETGADGSDSIN